MNHAPGWLGRPLGLCALLALSLTACSPVRNVVIRDDFDKVDRTATYRLHIVSAPLPAGDAKVGAMMSNIARRYVHDHRDFIVRAASAQQAAPSAESHCKGKIEGVLWLDSALAPKGEEVAVTIRAELRRCKGWVRIWSAEVADTWPSADDQLVALTQRYTAESGAVAKTYAAPAFRALRLLLDTLPLPKLIKDEDIDEKIEM